MKIKPNNNGAPDTQSAETAVAATLLAECPQDLPPYCRRLITNAPESFNDQRLGNLAVVIRQLREQGKPVAPITVRQHLRDNLEKVGDAPFIDSLASQAVPVDLAEYEAVSVWEAYRTRRLKSVYDDAATSMASDPGKSDSILATVRAALDALEKEHAQPAPHASRLTQLQRRTKDDPRELLKSGYCYRGSGGILAAPTGVGKTVLEIQAAIQFALGMDFFGIKPTRPLKSVIVEAENSECDLAEIADGIIAGLGLTAEELERVDQHVAVYHEDSHTGLELFQKVIEPLLVEHRPDLLWLDPANAYLGGDVSSQEDVGRFLRNWLNPLLRKFQCACIIIAHTAKPLRGKEKADWQAGDFAYLPIGSSEWANWPRFVLAIRSIGQHSVFELRAGKRGARIGWRDENDEPAYSKLIAHSKEPGRIYWREANPSDLETQPTGRPREHDAEEVLDLLPPEGLTASEWQRLADKECGMKEATFHRNRRKLAKSKRVVKSVSGKWTPIKAPEVSKVSKVSKALSDTTVITVTPLRGDSDSDSYSKARGVKTRSSRL